MGSHDMIVTMSPSVCVVRHENVTLKPYSKTTVTTKTTRKGQHVSRGRIFQKTKE